MKGKCKASSILLVLFIALSVTPLMVTSAKGATNTQIEASGAAAVAYLANKQNPDGSWGSGERVATTGLVLLKLLDRAKEMNLDPFNNNPSSPTYYEYAVNVIQGFEYLLGNAHVVDITSQRLGNPDNNGNGKGIVFYSDDYPYHHTYNTGIALTAFAFSGHPDDRSATLGPLGVRTYRQIAQDTVDWLCFAQGDSGNDVGGYGYYALDNNQGGPTDWTDNSNAGYAYMGLAFAEELPFNCIIPQWIRDASNVWITTIQDPSGASLYNPDWWSNPMINVLKTGNLIFEMAFYGDLPNTPRVQAAVNYLETHWKDPNWDPGWGYSMAVANYQAKFLIEKGLKYMGIDELDIDGDGTLEDWFNQEPSASPSEDFASVIVAQQLPNGGWPNTLYDDDSNAILSTAWAALTLEKFAPTRFEGFVTGGGWIKPESGIGNNKASFGFVVKYHKGSMTPDGNLEFQYKYRDLNLKSIEMKWLVIHGNKAIFQGTATVNGKGTYTVRVEAVDGDLFNGQPDQFHITIWAGTNTETTPIYNYSNYLSGGNIDIHRQ